MQNCDPKLKILLHTFGFLLALLPFAFFLLPAEASAATIGRPANNLGLVGYWDFDVGKGGDTAYDRSGNGNDGVLTSMDSESDWVDGSIGQGTTFNGDQPAGVSETNPHHIEIPESSILRPTTQWSVSGWVKPDVLPQTANGTGIFDYGSNDRISVQVINRGVRINAGGSWSAIAKDFSEVGAGAGEWIHVVANYDNSAGNGDLELYFNGQLVGSASGVAESVSHTQSAWIGRRHDHHEHTLKGDLDDVRIYNRALSSGEVERLYKLGTSGGQTIASTKTVIEDGLIGHWTFDGDVTNANTTSDVSGNGNDGTINGSVPAIGKLGQAFEFDGVDDYVLTPGFAVLGSSTAAFSVSGWIKPESTNGTIFHHKQVDGGWSTGLVGFKDDKLSFNIYSLGFESETGTTSIDQWTHVLLTRDQDDNNRLYKNGTLVASNNGSYSASGGNNALGIGRFRSDCCEFDSPGWFDGVIDDVRIYNRALTEDEIQRIYNAGASEKINSSRTNRLTSGLVGHWTFDGDVTNANTTSDVSGNGNNGTVNGAVPGIGVLGQAFEFDGVNDVVNVADSSVLDMGSNDFTVSTWIQTPTNGGIVSKGDSDAWWQFKVISSKLSFSLNDGTTGVGNLKGNVDPTDNAWHHALVVVNRGSGEANLYFDGTFDATLDISSVTGSVDNNVLLRIGESRSSVENFNGKIDDVRIYNRALSSDEVYELYNLGR